MDLAIALPSVLRAVFLGASVPMDEAQRPNAVGT